MSKIKDNLLRVEEQQVKYMSKFLDAMYDVLHQEPRLREDDINKLEETQLRASSVSKQIISTQELNKNEIKDIA